MQSAIAPIPAIVEPSPVLSGGDEPPANSQLGDPPATAVNGPDSQQPPATVVIRQDSEPLAMVPFGVGEENAAEGEQPAEPESTPAIPQDSVPARQEPALALQPAGASPYLDLAPAPGAPLDRALGSPLVPAPPVGWNWYPVEGTSCRDGSETGLYMRFTESEQLLIVFEGGGACTNKGFCDFNPKSVDEVLFGTGETVLGTALGAVAGRQQPGVYSNNQLAGIFSERSENPFNDWNIAYIPYCTGDVHFGTKRSAPVPGLEEPQQFVGYFNTQKIIGRLRSTFQTGLRRVVVTGMSAGSFGAALNFSMISDAFGVQTDAILDSGIPFEDQYWPTCQQQSWRETFGLNDALPPDCAECFQEDGGGLLGLTDFILAKHPSSRIAMVSSMNDEVIRLFFTPGEDQCATVESADPVGVTLGQLAGGQLFPAAKYEAGLQGVRALYEESGAMASYFLAGGNVTFHQHIMRDRFFEVAAGSQSIAQFVSAFLDGELAHVGM